MLAKTVASRFLLEKTRLESLLHDNLHGLRYVQTNQYG